MDGIERKRDDQGRSRNYRLATIWDLNMGRRFQTPNKNPIFFVPLLKICQGH